MAIIRRSDSLFNAVPGLRDEMNRLFDNVLTGPVAFTRGDQMTAAWVPAIDVAEGENAVTVTAEIPGIKPEEIDINLTGNLLTIRGEKREDKEEQGRNWHRVERSYGTFSRSLQLPDTVDPERAKASYDNGVLTVEIAKSEASRPRSIKVGVGGRSETQRSESESGSSSRPSNRR